MNMLIIFLILLSSIAFATTQNNSSSYPNFNIADIPTKDCAISNCYHGRCITIDKCFCNNDYAQFPIQSTDGVYCTYRRQNQLKIFLVEFFFSFGIGHIVAGNTGYGLFKMFLPVLACIAFCCGGLFIEKSGAMGVGILGLGVICGIVFGIMQIYDICTILLGSYLDGNGVSLSPSF